MNYLYACLFSTGVIKIGRAKNAGKRIRQHTERVSCLGVTLQASESVACADDPVAAESALIRRCQETAGVRHKREWFDDLEFSDVVDWMRQEAAIARVRPVNENGIGGMHKTKAVELLGGTASAAAEAVGITPAAISQWPDELPPRLVDRVLAALVRLRPDDWAQLWPEPAAKETA
jgi:hypothetical protein